MKALLRLVTVAFLLAWVAAPVHAQLNGNEGGSRGLGKAYGFFVGQIFRLERIEKAHPDLKNQVLLAKLEFTTAFPNFETNAKKSFASWGAKEADIENMVKTWREAVGPMVEREPIDLETSKSFLEDVRKRAKGIDVPEDVLQYLLATSFMDHPEAEMARGWHQKYSSKNHPKAKGVTVLLKAPMSYKRMEGERPNIVAKWTSEGGNGLEMLMLLVLASDERAPTRKEIEDDIKRGAKGELRQSFSEAGTVLNMRAFSQEKAAGVIADMQSNLERTGIEFTMRRRQFLLFLPGRSVSLECQVGAKREDAGQLEGRFNRIADLCLQVANSLVLPQQYQGGR